MIPPIDWNGLPPLNTVTISKGPRKFVNHNYLPELHAATMQCYAVKTDGTLALK